MTKHLSEVHVRWDSDRRQWVVFKSEVGTGYVTAKEDSVSWLKFFAVWKSVSLAKNSQPCEWFMHGKDGRIQERRTYPRSADPKGRG